MVQPTNPTAQERPSSVLLLIIFFSVAIVRTFDNFFYRTLHCNIKNIRLQPKNLMFETSDIRTETETHHNIWMQRAKFPPQHHSSVSCNIHSNLVTSGNDICNFDAHLLGHPKLYCATSEITNWKYRIIICDIQKESLQHLSLVPYSCNAVRG